MVRRLYLRIYFAVLARLTVFALAAALLWLGFAESARGLAQVTALLRNVLCSPGASVTEQQTVLERASRGGLDVDASLFAADGAPEPAPAPAYRHRNR
jgi:hypothetical protein